MNDRFPDEIDEALWDEACRQADAIREFLRRNPDGATAADVSGLAVEMEVSQATAYRLIKLFRAGGTVLSLVDRKRGRPQGYRALDGRREEIIRSTIKLFYLKPTRPTISQLVAAQLCGVKSCSTMRPNAVSGPGHRRLKLRGFF